MLRDEEDRACLGGFSEEGVTVEAFALDGEEAIGRLDGAGIDGDAVGGEVFVCAVLQLSSGHLSNLTDREACFF